MRSIAGIGGMKRFWRSRKATAAIEFALLVPMMIALYIGAVEFSQALTIDRRVTTVASSLADLVAQAEEVSNDEVIDIFEAATAIIKPFDIDPLSMVVSSVVADGDNDTEVAWSRTKNGTARAKGSSMALPEGLTQPYTGIIVAEVEYTYTPIVGEYITGPIKMSDTFYLRPRRSLTVEMED